jgi:hypothetical protein
MKIPGGGGRGPGAEPSVLCAVRHVHDTATEYSHRRACRAAARSHPIARITVRLRRAPYIDLFRAWKTFVGTALEHADLT